MSYNMKTIENYIIEAVKQATSQKTAPYDDEAEVVRIDGDTAWVHFAGGVEETPVRLTINAKKGDKVQVRVSNDGAYIIGNATNPPTNDDVANLALSETKNIKTNVSNIEYIANEANEIAGYAMRSADGKSTVYHMASAPTGGEYQVGDTWFNSSEGYAIYTWSGSAWVKEELGEDAIANLAITNAKIANGTIQSAKIGGLDVGKLTGGYIDAGHINTGAMTIGSFSNDFQNAVMNDKIQIGGRNLLRNSKNLSSFTAESSTYISTSLSSDYITLTRKVVAGKENTGYGIYYDDIPVYANTEYSLSFDVNGTLSDELYTSIGQKIPTGKNNWNGVKSAQVISSTGRYSLTFNTNAATSIRVCIALRNINSTQWSIQISNAKLEIGNKPTDWTPAPEDVDEAIGAKKSTHTLMSANSSGASYATILGWAAEGVESDSLAIDTTETPLTNVEVGDTVRLAYKVSNVTGTPYVYVLGTVNSISGSNITLIGHGIDTTVIDGGMVLTGKVAADRVDVNAITVGQFSSDVRDAFSNVGGRNVLRNSALVVPSFNIFTRASFSISNTNWGQVVDDWNCYSATRIRGSGCTDKTPLFFGGANNRLTVPVKSVSGQWYTYSVYIWNRASTAISVTANGATNASADQGRSIASGEKTRIVITCQGNDTSNVQLNINTATAGDSVDVVLWRPKIELGANLGTEWSPAPEDSQGASGRNILRGTDEYKLKNYWAQACFYRSNGDGVTDCVFNYNMTTPLSGVTKGVRLKGCTTATNVGFAQGQIPFKKGWHTLSAWVKGTSGTSVRLQGWYNSTYNSDYPYTSGEKTLNGTWQHIYEHFYVPADVTMAGGYVYYYGGNNTSAYCDVTGVKLERGLTPTDWTPAVEDSDTTIYDGRNLVADSLKAANVTSYAYINDIHKYDFTEHVVENEMYTVTAEIEVGSNVKSIAFYHSQGSSSATDSFREYTKQSQGENLDWRPVSTGTNIVTATAAATSTMAGQTTGLGFGQLWVCVSNSASGGNSGRGTVSAANAVKVKWVKVEKGYKSTSWDGNGVDSDQARRTATSYITEVNSTGIKVHPSGDATSYAGITSDGLDVVKSGDSVAFYGDSARIGKEDNSHIEMDWRSFKLVDRDGDTYVYFSDLRDTDGTYTETFTGDGSTKTFTLMFFISSSYTVKAKINGTATTAFSYTAGTNTVTFNSAPANNATITIQYIPTLNVLKAFSIGERRDGDVGLHSVCVGYDNLATYIYSQAFGAGCQSKGIASIAMGVSCEATGDESFACGNTTKASKGSAFAAGYRTEASGSSSVAIGSSTKASASYSHAQNLGTVADKSYQTAIGKYNTTNITNNLFVIGKGSSSSSRSNALTVDTSGNEVIAGTLTQSSDRRLKDHLDYLGEDAVEFIRGLKPAHYIKDDEHHVGFYAQDVEEVDKWDCMVGEMNDYKTLGYTEIIAPLVAYVQKLESRIEELERERK